VLLLRRHAGRVLLLLHAQETRLLNLPLLLRARHCQQDLKTCGLLLLLLRLLLKMTRVQLRQLVIRQLQRWLLLRHSQPPQRQQRAAACPTLRGLSRCRCRCRCCC
jgi:hypothetical protein